MGIRDLFQFNRSRQARPRGVAHMTYASRTMSRTISGTMSILKRQLWIWPLIAVAVLSVVGISVRSAIQQTMETNVRSQLVTLLNVETAMLENWVNNQISNAAMLANDARVRTRVCVLLSLHDQDAAPMAAAQTSGEDHVRELRKSMGPAMTAHDYYGFFIADRTRVIRAASNQESIGRSILPEVEPVAEKVLDGESAICPPFMSLPDANQESAERREEPCMFVCVPIRDEDYQVIAMLGLRIRPDREFTRILQLGRIGESGETYAFDKNGLMVSNSRFDDDLILIGILPDEPGTTSILRLPLRDPGQDVTVKGRPRLRRADMPLTYMASQATQGNSGVNVRGYRDYRGVNVVGAWTWLTTLNVGVATEMDYAEAFRPLAILHTAFWSMYGLLALAAVAIFIFTIITARMRIEAQKAAIEAKELGQYKLEQKLGAGAMGVVYRGYHAMLRRPTAIKLLNADKVNDGSIQRFEHEVQITCQLNHPNTIAIYDYGRTPEGLFYYAMEYLDGIDLEQLVSKYGPLPEARVIHILRQICGSLYEAHSKGLVHRDIKPSNIMLNRRGGEADVVKVLDFGLVKAMDDKKQQQLSAANSLTGTPLYMSPEAIQSPMLVDACSDIYAIGAVGYFLLCGKPVFAGSSVVELLQQHVSATPVPPSERIGKAVSEEVEHAVMACLEKNRAKRPQTAKMLSQLLDKSPAAGKWTQEAAEAWWGRHERGLPPGSGSSIQITPDPHAQTMVSNTEIEPHEV